MKFLSYLSESEKKIFFLLVSIVFFSLIYVLVIEPMAKSYKNLGKQLALKKIKLSKDLKLTSQKDRVLRQYNALTENILLKSSDDKEAASMLTAIEDMARTDNINILDMKPLTPKDGQLYKEFNVEIKFEARIDGISKFIYDIVSSQNAFRIERLTLNRKNSESDALISTITVSKISVKPIDI